MAKILELSTFSDTDTVAEAVSVLQDLIAGVKAMYPVGSVLITTTSTNPSEYLGGTWTSYGADRFLMGVGTKSAGATGGSTTHRHKIGFGVNADAFFIRTNGSDAYYGGVGTGLSSFKLINGTTANAISSSVVSGSAIWETKNDSYSESYSESVETYPPYIVAYFWKREA